MKTIGFYSKNVFCSSTDTLYELTDTNINYIIESIPECPYDKKSQKKEYDEWKKNNLPLVFFTYASRRPDENSAAMSSGYAVIDIDCVTKKKIISNHPSVCCTNYTGGGTHIFIYADKWGLTPAEWQQTYNRIAYEIWYELNAEYPGIRFDGHSARHNQGCFLWNTEWIGNKRYDSHYTVSENVYVTDNILEQMYEKSSYSKCTLNTVKNYTDKNVITRTVERINSNVEFSVLAERISISDKMKEDFAVMKRTDFLRKYEAVYTPVTGTRPDFNMYKDYEGNIYYMYKTNGEMIRLWQPVMQNKNNLSVKPDGRLDYEIKTGGRRKSLYAHLVQAAQYLDFTNGMDADRLLYDAVYWIANYCENGLSFPSKEILSTLDSALLSYKSEEDRMYYDKRTFVSGKHMLDMETGELVTMNKGMKLKANAKCRKTERITEVISQWKPEQDIDWNVEHIKSWEYKQTMNLKRKTFVNYIKCAKEMPELVERFEWLKDFDLKTRPNHRPSDEIVIKNVETNETYKFESKTECMKWLGISNRQSFKRFLEGTTKLNKLFKVL